VAPKSDLLEKITAAVTEALQVSQGTELKTITDFPTAVKKARDIWYNEDIVSMVGSLMVSAANNGFEIVDSRKNEKTIYDYWAANVNKNLKDRTPKGLDQLAQWIFTEYWQSGLVVVYLSWGHEEGAPKSSPAKKINLPWKASIINPLSLQIQGSSLLGNAEYSFTEDAMPVDLEESTTMQSVPMLPQGAKPTRTLPLKKSDSFYVLKRGAQPYMPYPVPYLARVFPWIDLRGRLRNMDYQTALKVILSVIIFKILSNNPKDKEKIKNEVIKNLGPNSILATSANFDVSAISPDVESLLSWDKYREADLLIREALGLISITGMNVNRSEAVFNPRPLIAEIHEGRRNVQRLLESIMQEIAEKNNFKEVPNVKFNRIRLFENDQVFKTMVRDLYDRGVISQRTYAEEADYEYEIEVARREAEKEFEDLMQPHVVFRQGVVAPAGNKTVDVGNVGGRPSGKEDNVPERKVKSEINADFSTEKYHHLENPEFPDSDLDEYVGTITLKDGILGRLARKKSTGNTAIKVFLFDKEKFSLEEAKKWLEKHT